MAIFLFTLLAVYGFAFGNAWIQCIYKRRWLILFLSWPLLPTIFLVHLKDGRPGSIWQREFADWD